MSKKSTYKLNGEVWLWGYDTEAPWHFVSVPQKESAQIKKDFGILSRGWRSLPVSVTIGKSKWRTSVFMDSRTQSYLLPLKASIRKKEGVYKGDKIKFSIKILV
jgi:hypothetical protein